MLLIVLIMPLIITSDAPPVWSRLWLIDLFFYQYDLPNGHEMFHYIRLNRLPKNSAWRCSWRMTLQFFLKHLVLIHGEHREHILSSLIRHFSYPFILKLNFALQSLPVILVLTCWIGYCVLCICLRKKWDTKRKGREYYSGNVGSLYGKSVRKMRHEKKGTGILFGKCGLALWEISASKVECTHPLGILDGSNCWSKNLNAVGGDLLSVPLILVIVVQPLASHQPYCCHRSSKHLQWKALSFLHRARFLMCVLVLRHKKCMTTLVDCCLTLSTISSPPIGICYFILTVLVTDTNLSSLCS
jgi:hypothetical protein